MEASTTTNGSDGVRTFRGRNLEELLPQIREALGPEAIVLRRREGLTGGVGGFFQRPYVEVEARAPLGDEHALELRSDRATAEGLASPAVQALFEQATPFADALAAASRDARTSGEDYFSATVSETPRVDPTSHAPERRVDDFEAGLYGPQPNALAIAHTLSPPAAGEPAEVAIPAAPMPTGLMPDPVGPDRPTAADAAERRLVSAGLSPGLAADIVSEAVVHGLPFTTPRNLKKLVRGVLARRIPVPSSVGSGPRTIAVVGAGGSGKTSAVAHLAAAYAASGADIAVIALRADGALAGRLHQFGIAVLAAGDAAEARRKLGSRRPLITLIDTPAAGPSYDAAHLTALVEDLRAFDGAEVHLALPATLSAAAADEIAAALSPLAPTHIALTHADETLRPGAVVELALAAGRPLSYVCARESATPVDPAALALRLLP